MPTPASLRQHAGQSRLLLHPFLALSRSLQSTGHLTPCSCGAGLCAWVGFCPASWGKKLPRCSRPGLPTSPNSLWQPAGEGSSRTHLLFLQNSEKSPDKITGVCIFPICLGFFPASPLLAAASTSAESSNWRSVLHRSQQAHGASGGAEGDALTRGSTGGTGFGRGCRLPANGGSRDPREPAASTWELFV